MRLRWKRALKFDKYEKAFVQLELQYENYVQSANRTELSKLDKEALAESVIQRFEVSYDIGWKHLKRYMVEVLALPDVPSSPKPVLRLADTNNLLGDNLERWIEYAEARVATSHDYSGEKAADCLTQIDDYINDAILLYEKLTGSKWKSLEP